MSESARPRSTAQPVEPDAELPQIDDADAFRAPTPDGHLGGYAWWQPHEAPAMVFLHGWAQDASYHADRARALHADGWHAISVGFRGWPGSTGDAEDYGLSAHIDIPALVSAVREQAPVSEVYLFGFSAGGLVAARGAPYADGLTGLITLNAPMNVHTQYRDGLADRMRTFYDRSLTDEHWERCSPVTVADQLTVPLLAMAGLDDAMIAPTQAKEISDLVERSTHVTFEGMRHLPTATQWDDVMATVARWVNEVRAGAA